MPSGLSLTFKPTHCNPYPETGYFIHMSSCILCRGNETSVVFEGDPFTCLACPECGLHFANPEERLRPEVEKKRYDHHQNDPADPDYRDFLNQLFEPLNNRLPPNCFGLDFGSGPGPALHLMFEEAGHRMNIFDPFYAKNPSVLNLRYDFITATETVEHLFRPREEFEMLWKILKPGGYLGIMTLLLSDPDSFDSWFYRRDDTHVAFYQKKTFEWLAHHLGADVEFISSRVIILKKK